MITVVILPGMDGTGIELTDFVAALAPEVEAIVVTYPNDRPMDYAGHEAVARTSLPIDRPFVLLGESYSGPIAISIAASAPPGLIGLVLCCSFARNPRPALSWLRRLVPFVPTRIPAAVPCWFLLGRFSTPRLENAIAQVLAQIDPGAFRARLNSIIDVDVTARLAAVRVPVLYLARPAIAWFQHGCPRRFCGQGLIHKSQTWKARTCSFKLRRPLRRGT